MIHILKIKSSTYSKRLNKFFENTVELISKHPNIGNQKEDVKNTNIP